MSSPAGTPGSAGGPAQASTTSYPLDGLNLAAAEVADLHSRLSLPQTFPASGTGPARVDPATGNLSLALTVPGAGPFDPEPVLTYNSLASGRKIQYVYGFAELFNSTAKVFNSQRAWLFDGRGSLLQYNDIDTSGRYAAPGGADCALVLNSDGTLTATQPNGLSLYYGTDNQLGAGRQPQRWLLDDPAAPAT